ncbi:unknown [Bacteroides sp. CAG:702]|nr:unknown [Bacteroides sp. CAG:702]
MFYPYFYFISQSYEKIVDASQKVSKKLVYLCRKTYFRSQI